MQHKVEDMVNQSENMYLPFEILYTIFSMMDVSIEYKLLSLCTVSKLWNRCVFHTITSIDDRIINKYACSIEKRYPGDLFKFDDNEEEENIMRKDWISFLSKLTNLKEIKEEDIYMITQRNMYERYTLLMIIECIVQEKMFSSLQVLYSQNIDGVLLHLTSLRILTLTNSHLHDEELSNCNELEELTLIKCKAITSDILENGFRWTLRFLRIDCAQNIDIIRYLDKLPVLEELEITDDTGICHFYKPVAHRGWFDNLRRLKKLRISDYRISFALDEYSFSSLTNLESLYYISFDRFDSQFLTALTNLKELTLIEHPFHFMNNNRIEVMNSLAILPNLNKVMISTVEGLTPSYIDFMNQREPQDFHILITDNPKNKMGETFKDLLITRK